MSFAPQASSSKSKRPHSASNEGEGLDSTSTPAPEAPKRPKKVPFEDAFSRFFAQYASAAEPDQMDGEGIEQLFKDMDLSMDGVGLLGSFIRMVALTDDPLLSFLTGLPNAARPSRQRQTWIFWHVLAFRLSGSVQVA